MSAASGCLNLLINCSSDVAPRNSSGIWFLPRQSPYFLLKAVFTMERTSKNLSSVHTLVLFFVFPVTVSEVDQMNQTLPVLHSLQLHLNLYLLFFCLNSPSALYVNFFPPMLCVMTKCND